LGVTITFAYILRDGSPKKVNCNSVIYSHPCCRLKTIILSFIFETQMKIYKMYVYFYKD